MSRQEYRVGSHVHQDEPEPVLWPFYLALVGAAVAGFAAGLGIGWWLL